MTFSELDDPKLGETVRKVNTEWVTAMQIGDATTIALPYADDGILILIDGTSIRGRTEIGKVYQTRFERSGIATSARLDLKTLIVDGELAYESGFGEIETVREGTLSKTSNRYLTVWQRKLNGEWRIIRNIILP